MSHRLRAVLYALGVLLVLTLLLITWRATVTAQEDVPASTSSLTENPAVIAPAAPVPGGPGFYSQTSLAFQPWPSQATPFSYSGRTLLNPDSSSHAYEAAVSLPQGATITKFVVWYSDNNASADMWAVIARMALDDSSVAQIARIDSSGAVPSVRYLEDTTIETPTIDMQSYTYWVEAYLPPNSAAGVVSFRIDYRYASSLPLIMKK